MQVRAIWQMRSFMARLLGMHSIHPQHRAYTVLFFARCKLVHSMGLYSQHAVLFLGTHGQIVKGPLAMRPNRVYGSWWAVEAVELPITVLRLRQSALEQKLKDWRSGARLR